MASSATCALVIPAEAVIIGSVAGGVVTFCIEWLEMRLEVDDPGGAVSVHAIGGMWGLVAAVIFGQVPAPIINSAGAALPAASDSGQWLAQLVGVATLIGFVLPLTYGLNWLANRLYPYRVSVEGERQGLDLHELGAGAYPEFVTHSDDFLPR